MATPKSSKRSYSDSESDTETQQSSFPHFIVLESIEDKPMSKLSPFVIEKTLSGLFTPVYVKKLGNGTLLVEVNKKPYADILLKIKSFGGLKIKAFAHLSLNTSKGVVRSSELSLCTLDELKSHLANQGVTDIKRISIKRNEETINTNTYILTFNKSSLPKELKVGYNFIKVNPYIPNPLRCYNCQKFSHHETKCLKSPVCKKCGESGSDHIELSCNNAIKCANCQGNHPADSRDCLVWKKEKEINTIKYTNNISFPEARKLIQSRNQFPTRSYAQVTTPNPEPKHDHSCETARLCALFEARLTPGCVAPITDREALCRYSVDLLHLTRPRAVCPAQEAVDTSEHSSGATPGLSYADHRPGGSVPSQRIPPHPSSGCVPCTRGRQHARAHVVSRH